MNAATWFPAVCFFALCGYFIWESWRRPVVCEGKIVAHVRARGGEVVSMERVGVREDVYYVHYRIGNKGIKGVVRFSFLYEPTWKWAEKEDITGEGEAVE